MKRLAGIAAAMLAATLANAQDAEPAGSPESRKYTVEVIIFEYAERVSVGTEVFAPDPPPEQDAGPPPEFVFEDARTERQSAALPANAAVSEGPEFILHSEDEFTLTDVMRRLELLDVYEPIMHFAWTQATVPDEETLPIELGALADPPERLNGSFRLYLSRYLHLVVDLALDDLHANGEPVAIDEPANVYSDNRPGSGFPDVRAPAVKLRIQEDRIFKSGELRYFDHPKFGVLAKITRVEETEEEQVIEPEMLGDGPVALTGDIDE
jgi:hypothetical protein